MERNNNDAHRSMKVDCSTQWEHEAAEKVVKTMGKAMVGGLLGRNWTIKVQRRDGGKIRVWFEAEDDAQS